MKHFAIIAALPFALAACGEATVDETAGEDVNSADAPIDSSAGDMSAAADGGAADNATNPAGATTAASGTSDTASLASRPVMYGGEAEYDGCASAAQVGNLNPRGDNYLSVRSAPSTSAREKDRLGPDQMVSVCDSTNGWSGIVYSKNGDNSRCGTGTPVATRAEYTGPCSYGWVSDDFLTNVAG